MFAEMPGGASPSPRDGAIDFFSPATDGPSAMRYGVLIEVEEYWQSLGVLWGELLYSISLTPGDEAKLAVLDGRWRREAEGRERPLQILARMVGDRKSTRLNSSHSQISYAVFCLKKKN